MSLLISFSLFSQENNIFKFNLLGATVEEIIKEEGNDHELIKLAQDGSDYFNRIRNGNIDIETYKRDNFYIARLYYHERLIFGHRSFIIYRFTPDGICSGCCFFIDLPKSNNIADHFFLFDEIYNYLLNLYDNSRMKIISTKQTNYQLELDSNILKMRLVIQEKGNAYIYLQYLGR
jgi:hypothetical protein